MAITIKLGGKLVPQIKIINLSTDRLVHVCRLVAFVLVSTNLRFRFPSVFSIQFMF